jgi:hypothetical protein
MLNYLKKFALEILPSVFATVIGAYIVNHYVSRPAATDTPVAGIVAPADAKKKDNKPADGAAEVVSIPERGVKAKGISERAMLEKSASERPGEFKPAESTPAEAKSVDVKPAETASAPTDSRRHVPAPSPRTAARVAVPAPAPAVSPAAQVEAAAPAAAEDHRDAADLARAAIERLRGSDGQPRTQEASRTPAAPRLQDVPQTVTPSPSAAAMIRPLPPPITVAAPPVEAAASPPPYTASTRNNDPDRLTPPADIPPPPPVDLRADASKLATRTTNMAQDVLHAAKSMFHAVLPNSDRQGSSSASQFADD